MKETTNGCLVCESNRTGYEFQVGIRRIERCQECNILFERSLFPDNRTRHLNENLRKPSVVTPVIESEAKVSLCIERLKNRGMQQSDRLWIGGNGYIRFVDCAKESGFEVADIDFESIGANTVDTCVLLDILGESSNPLEQLLSVRELLKPDAILLITVPTLDSDEARRQKSRWGQFATGRLTYFDRHGLSALLVRVGFGRIKMYSETDGVVVICQKENFRNDRPLLSIVLPVYNERATFEQLIKAILEKTFDTVDREIIIMESNSTDGSRELVQTYEARPDVKVIYENKPQGKGHAVRNGLNHASGSMILIQDADLEYDIEDYDVLLTPIVRFRSLFVLGSRHKGHWKMREFGDSNILSGVFNFGQVFFTWLINITCGTQLMDPFTMYKVFHRECLYGLELESNRFDLDWEIVIKFVRKGLVPMEIPVNYVSRSFGEGKKVRLLLDPILWIIALLKFRYGLLYSNTICERR